MTNLPSYDSDAKTHGSADDHSTAYTLSSCSSYVAMTPSAGGEDGLKTSGIQINVCEEIVMNRCHKSGGVRILPDNTPIQSHQIMTIVSPELYLWYQYYIRVFLWELRIPLFQKSTHIGCKVVHFTHAPLAWIIWANSCPRANSCPVPTTSKMFSHNLLIAFEGSTKIFR